MDRQVADALERYAKRVRDTLRGAATHAELALAPAFKSLVDDLLPLIPAGTGLVTVPEYAKQDVGRPDIALVRAGQPPRAFVELKAPGKTLDPGRWRDPHDKRQFSRFRELPTWALSNFNGIRLYRRDTLEREARLVPEGTLDPTTSDAKAAALIAGHDASGLLDNAPQKGVIAFITNRTFLAGKPYAGLRKMLRERFDRIEIIDLRGDLRRGARAGIKGDTGVFNIRVGTAITLAIADGTKADGALAEITYTDTWELGHFPREAKLRWLEEGAKSGTRPGAIPIVRGKLDDFKPVPFQAHSWPVLTGLFGFHKSGVKTGRNAVFTAFDRAALKENVQGYLSSTSPQRYDFAKEAFYSFRALDRRWFYNDLRLLDRPGPELQSVWGAENLALYSHPSAITAGPAVWCHALLPDYDSFRGSYGGYAFPLYDRRPGHGPINLSPTLLDSLAVAYAAPVTPEAVFDAMLALLSATSYTLRFAEDLEDVFPHVPFPADRKVFEKAAAIGAAIREVETFARAPGATFMAPTLARLETAPTGKLASDWDDGELRLCADGSGRVTGVPTAVWEFAVSGYRVLPRWLAAREGVEVDDTFFKEFRDIHGRINELIHHFDEADLVLEEALTHSLTRERLGLGPAAGEDHDERP